MQLPLRQHGRTILTLVRATAFGAQQRRPGDGVGHQEHIAQVEPFQPLQIEGRGSTERTLAELALRRNRWFTPHTWTNGIGVLANLHVCCGVGGGPFLEFPYDPPGWTPERRDFMLAEPIEADADGFVHVPDTPGLGITLDEDRISHYEVS